MDVYFFGWAYFLAEYRAGRTPNPDVLCNSEIKFKAFLEHALKLKADYIATGHYARLAGEAGQRQLLKAVDRNKDQSYFLYRLSQPQIARAMFPLGEMTKPEVRELARQSHLAVAEKKDSTGICFIGERPFREFLQRYLPTQPGDMVTPEGKVVGRHVGLMFYTLGQRKGLGIGGLRDAEPDTPWFVAGKDLAGNRLMVVQGHDHPLLLSTSLSASDLNWIGPPPRMGGRYGAKPRYRQEDDGLHGGGGRRGRPTAALADIDTRRIVRAVDRKTHEARTALSNRDFPYGRYNTGEHQARS